MHTHIKDTGKLLLIVAVFIGCSGCMSGGPLYVDQSYSQKNIQRIVLLPIVDNRLDKSYEIDFVKNKIKETLKEKGYEIFIANSFSPKRRLRSDDIAKMKIEDLATLGPEDDSHIMLFYLEKYKHRNLGIGVGWHVIATACIISKERKVEIWRDTAEGCFGDVGFAAMIILELIHDNEELDDCLSHLFASLPYVQNPCNVPGQLLRCATIGTVFGILLQQ